MKRLIIAALLAGACAGAACADDIIGLADRLSGTGGYCSSAEYEILLPTADNPMTYALDLRTDSPDADSLAPVSYLISWQLGEDTDKSDGFTAYFSGHLYQYRDRLLREYHYADNAQTFAPGGEPRLGLQNNMQFLELLPQYIGRRFREMAADSTYKYNIADTVIAGDRVVAVDVVRSYMGETAAQYRYIFEPESLRPLRSETVSNPGAAGEQILSVTYSYPGNGATPTDEETLAAMFPDAFNNHRESVFTPAALIGRTFPPFSLPSVSRERYTLDKGRGFRHPTVIAILDAEAAETPKIISGLRRAANGGNTGLIMAFVNNNADLIENAAGRVREGEYLLMNARGLARTCGAADLPAIFYCDTEAIITDATEGVNNASDNVVIQKTAALAE